MKILKKRARKFMEGAMDFEAKMLSPPHSFFFSSSFSFFLFLFFVFFFFVHSYQILLDHFSDFFPHRPITWNWLYLSM